MSVCGALVILESSYIKASSSTASLLSCMFYHEQIEIKHGAKPNKIHRPTKNEAQ
jgi:hypothetical protein